MLVIVVLSCTIAKQGLKGGVSNVLNTFITISLSRTMLFLLHFPARCQVCNTYFCGSTPKTIDVCMPIVALIDLDLLQASTIFCMNSYLCMWTLFGHWIISIAQHTHKATTVTFFIHQNSTFTGQPTTNSPLHKLKCSRRRPH